MDTQACSNILIPNIPLGLSGRYTGSLTFDFVVTSEPKAWPSVETDEIEDALLDIPSWEEMAEQVQGVTRDIAWDFQPETSTSGTAVCYMEDSESGELKQVEAMSFSYGVQGTRVIIELTAWNDPRIPTEIQVVEMRLEGELSTSDQGTEISGRSSYTIWWVWDDLEHPDYFTFSGPWSVFHARAE